MASRSKRLRSLAVWLFNMVRIDPENNQNPKVHSGSIKLILCEKPSQARDIARVLGVVKDGKTYIETRDGTVTWAFGHLLELADFGSYDPVFKSSLLLILV